MGSNPVAVVKYTYIHIHTNNTENNTKQTTHRTTQKLGRVRAVPRLCGIYPGICLTTEEKARKNLSQVAIHVGNEMLCGCVGIKVVMSNFSITVDLNLCCNSQSKFVNCV